MSYAENLTPTQRQLAAERKARLQRMNARRVPETPRARAKKVSGGERTVQIPISAPEDALHAEINKLREQLAVKLEAARTVDHRLRDEHGGSCIEMMLEDETPQYPSLSLIRRMVAGRFGLSIADITSNRRQAKLVRARHLAFYLAWHMTPRSLPAIGRFWGGYDHTSILHGRNKIAAAREVDKALDVELNVLERAIRDEAANIHCRPSTPSSEGLSG
jgi:chromosomal replication initiation ATPase DnaA